MRVHSRTIRACWLMGMLLLAVPCWAGAPWAMAWWTIDGGGEVYTSGNSWELSGTVGQWDSTPASGLTGGQWQLTGGFWTQAANGEDRLFKNGFE